MENASNAHIGSTVAVTASWVRGSLLSVVMHNITTTFLWMGEGELLLPCTHFVDIKLTHIEWELLYLKLNEMHVAIGC